jgi:hypothetical protein
VLAIYYYGTGVGFRNDGPTKQRGQCLLTILFLVCTGNPRSTTMFRWRTTQRELILMTNFQICQPCCELHFQLGYGQCQNKSGVQNMFESTKLVKSATVVQQSQNNGFKNTELKGSMEGGVRY